MNEKIKIGIIVKAWLREYEPRLYVLEAEIEQNRRTLVRASAKFINRDLAAPAE